MKKVSKIRLKEKYVKILKVVGIILCIFLGLFIFYTKEISDLTKLGYSKISSKKILFSFNKEYVMSIGENKTLNLAFESPLFNEKYIDNYAKINYFEQEHLIDNINKLLKIGYSNSDINIILSHGNDKSVTDFTKRDKVKYLEEFFSIDYAKLDNYDRYVQYSDETGEDEETTVLFVNLNLDKDDYTDSKEVTDFSIDMVVNKHRFLSENFKPDDLVEIDSKYTSDDDHYECNRIAYNAFKEMYQDASADGYDLVINSAYRSYKDQVDIMDFYREQYGQSYVDRYVAKAGYSEHQTGLAFDIGSRNSNIFANSKEYGWMLENAYKYGFILRFPKKYEEITGFRNEPWHFRYVGKEIAKYIQENDITLDEYYVIFLDK